MTVAALLTTALLLLVTGTSYQEGFQGYSITLTVFDSFKPNSNLTYSIHIRYRGILLGGMRTLQKEDCSFTFRTTEDPNYGPFLVSVNGMAGKVADRTYWELLGQDENGTTIRPNVGVGCYIPKPNEHIILRFTSY